MKKIKIYFDKSLNVESVWKFYLLIIYYLG